MVLQTYLHLPVKLPFNSQSLHMKLFILSVFLHCPFKQCITHYVILYFNVFIDVFIHQAGYGLTHSDFQKPLLHMISCLSLDPEA